MQARVKKALPALACLLLLAFALLLLSRPRRLSGDPTGAVPLALPDELGSWTGQDLLFCTSDQCGRSFLADALPPPPADGSPSACPACGAALSAVSPGERNLLPASTPLFRRVYSRPGHPDVTATVVFSGMERRSIHRPQICLVAQGNRIVDEYTHRARLGPDETFPLRVLELSRPERDASGAVVATSASVYAYWLFNPERETDSHLARFAWMTVDNVLRSYRPRWGYASIAIPRDPARPDAWKGELDSFLACFRPVITKVRADLDANRDRTVVLRGSSAEANRYDGAGPTTSAPAAAGE